MLQPSQSRVSEPITRMLSGSLGPSTCLLVRTVGAELLGEVDDVEVAVEVAVEEDDRESGDHAEHHERRRERPWRPCVSCGPCPLRLGAAGLRLGAGSAQRRTCIHLGARGQRSAQVEPTRDLQIVALTCRFRQTPSACEPAAGHLPCACMTGPVDVLTDRLQRALGAAFGPEYAATDPVLRPSQFADFQANVALALAKRLGSNPRAVAEALVEHLDVADVCLAPAVSGPGFVNLTLRGDWLAGAARRRWPATPRLGVPAQEPQVVPDRLLGAQRRQGDARRAPAHHRRRRRPGPDARAPRAPRGPAEPHRRLGHAVRHAHRAPPRRGRGLRARPSCWSSTRTRSTRRARAEVRRARPTTGSFADRCPRAAWWPCRPATRTRCGSGRS